jgi:hypothetical protein
MVTGTTFVSSQSDDNFYPIGNVSFPFFGLVLIGVRVIIYNGVPIMPLHLAEVILDLARGNLRQGDAFY